MGNEELQQGLDKIEELACGMMVVVLCAERIPWRCHIRFIS